MVRNIKYKEFLEEIQGCRVLDNITASVLTIEDVDQNYRAKYAEWLVNARLSKKQNISLKIYHLSSFKSCMKVKMLMMCI